MMILKILLTFAVIIAVYLWIRNQRSKKSITDLFNQKDKALARGIIKNTWIKPLMYSIAGLIIGIGILMFYFSWLDDNTYYQVTITHSQSGTSETFVTLKKHMRERFFITLSGREIWVSDLERIEIRKLKSEKQSSGSN